MLWDKQKNSESVAHCLFLCCSVDCHVTLVGFDAEEPVAIQTHQDEWELSESCWDFDSARTSIVSAIPGKCIGALKGKDTVQNGPHEFTRGSQLIRTNNDK